MVQKNSIVQNLQDINYEARAIPTTPRIGKDIFGGISSSLNRMAMENEEEFKQQQSLNQDMQKQMEAEKKQNIFNEISKAVERNNAALTQGKINLDEYNANMQTFTTKMRTQNPGMAEYIYKAKADLAKDPQYKYLQEFYQNVKNTAEEFEIEQLNNAKKASLVDAGMSLQDWRGINEDKKKLIISDTHYRLGTKDPNKVATADDLYKNFNGEMLDLVSEIDRARQQLEIEEGAIGAGKILLEVRQSAEQKLLEFKGKLIDNGIPASERKRIIDEEAKPAVDSLIRSLKAADPTQWANVVESAGKIFVENRIRELPGNLKNFAVAEKIFPVSIEKLIGQNDPILRDNIRKDVVNFITSNPEEKVNAISNAISKVKSTGKLPRAQFEDDQSYFDTAARLNKNTTLILNDSQLDVGDNETINMLKANLDGLDLVLSKRNLSGKKEREKFADVGKSYTVLDNLNKVKKKDPELARTYANKFMTTMLDENSIYATDIERSDFNKYLNQLPDGTLGINMQGNSILEDVAIAAVSGAGLGGALSAMSSGVITSGAALGATLGALQTRLDIQGDVDKLVSDVEKYNSNIKGLNNIRQRFFGENMRAIEESYKEPVPTTLPIRGMSTGPATQTQTPIPEGFLNNVDNTQPQQDNDSGFNLSSLNPLGSRTANASQLPVDNTKKQILPAPNSTAEFKVNADIYRKYPVKQVPLNEREEKIADFVNLALFENPKLRKWDQTTIENELVHYDEGGKRIPTIGFGYALASSNGTPKNISTITKELSDIGINISEETKKGLQKLSKTTGKNKALNQTELTNIALNLQKDAGGSGKLYNAITDLTTKFANEVKLQEYLNVVNNFLGYRDIKTGNLTSDKAITIESLSPPLRHALKIIAYNRSPAGTEKYRRDVSNALDKKDPAKLKSAIEAYGRFLGKKSGAGLRDRYYIAAAMAANAMKLQNEGKLDNIQNSDIQLAEGETIEYDEQGNPKGRRLASGTLDILEPIEDDNINQEISQPGDVIDSVLSEL